jgi:hypothetical protein
MPVTTVAFRLNTLNLMALLASAAFASQANAAAGRVDFATTGSTISGADGRQRPLERGTDLERGDTIRTDAAGRAQIRFPDGAYVSLQPNTEFSIKEYNFDGKTDGSERSFFGLAKGAMRTVTGLIGRINKNRYQISTPTATIGIRGTGGLISIGPDGSTLVNGSSGIWTITNPSGTIDVPAGTTGKAPAAPNQPPQQTTEKPSSAPPPPSTTIAISPAEQRTDTGASAVVVTTPAINTTPLVSGSNFALSAPLDGTCGGDCGAPGFTIITASAPVDTIFDSVGRLTQFTVTDPSFGATTYTLDVANGGMHGVRADGTEDFGTRDGVIAWGRWVGPVIVDTFAITNTFAPDQGLHYVVGVPTPVASLPVTGTFTYNFLGATSPTYANGGVPPGTVGSASLTANFTTGAVGINLAAIDGNGLAYNGSASGRMNASVPGAVFTTSGSGSGTGCLGVCSLTANGFFAGTGATHAGFSYNFTNTTQGSDFIGAVAVKK